jgi:carboxyl-terminal processing protease
MTLVTLALAAGILSQPVPSDDYAALWNRASQMIRNSYYARQSRKEEMERTLAEFEPKAKQAGTRAQFVGTLDAMIAKFNDSHFAFHPDDRQGYYMFDGLANQRPAPMPHIGAWFRSTPGGYEVRMVLNGGAAEKAGMRVGDLALSIAGEPFSPIEALRGKGGQTLSITWKRDDKTMTGEVEVREEPALGAFLAATRDSARLIEREGKRVGYVRLWTMANDQFRAALHAQLYGRLARADAFVLDLRDGFGGRPEGFADPFYRPSAVLNWRFNESQPANAQIFGFADKPLVVLINRGSRSAKEVLAHILKSSGRATVVGTTTAGAVLGTSPQRLTSWAYLEIPMVDLTVDGVRIERKGVRPDVEIADGYGPGGEDLALERAVAVAADKARE